MSKKKSSWQSLDVVTGAKETGIRANLPSAPSAGGGFGSSRFGGGGRGGGRPRRDRYDQSDSVADSADSWRRNGPAPARPMRRDRDNGGPRDRDRGDRGDREMPRGDRSSRYPRSNRDFDSSAPEEGNWRSSNPRPQPRTRIGIDSSSNGRGWGTPSSSRSFGDRDRDRDDNRGGFGSGRRMSSRPSSSNSKFSGTKKGFGSRRATVDDGPPEPRITYSKPATSRLSGRGRFTNSSASSSSAAPSQDRPPVQDDFPTLAPRKVEDEAPSAAATTTSKKSKSDGPAEQNGQAKKAVSSTRATSSSKPAKKKSPEQRSKDLQRNFMKKIKTGKVATVQELREGMKMKLKSTDSLTDCLSASILSEKSRVTLGDVAAALARAELASEIFIKVLGKLYEEVSATKMTDILEESKVNFDDFVPEDESAAAFYGDMLELTCVSPELDQQLESAPLDSISLDDLIALVSPFGENDFSLPACRKIGLSFSRLLLDDENCFGRGNDAAGAMKKICGGDVKKMLFITSVVEKWYQSSKPEGLDAKFQKLVDSGVIEFDDVQSWSNDQTDTSQAKRDALFAISDWKFTMDEAQTRARHEAEENEEDENDEDEDLGLDDYAGNLFQKAKHKTYSDIIYYDQ